MCQLSGEGGVKIIAPSSAALRYEAAPKDAEDFASSETSIADPQFAGDASALGKVNVRLID